MTDLDARLHALRDDLDWPSTPDLAAAVGARIEAEPRRPSRLGWPVARALPRAAPVLAVLLAAIVAVAVLLAAAPGVRARIADWLGIGAVRIERVERPPAPQPGAGLSLGRPVTLAAARRASLVPVPIVRALGAPDAVFIDAAVTGGGVSTTLVYRPGAGLPRSTGGVGALLTVLPGDGLALVQKVIGPDVPVLPVRVDGATGVFIAGRHVLVPPQRLAGNTLVWTTGGSTYRLESELGRDAALQLARTVR